MKKIYYIIIIGFLLIGFIFMSLVIKEVLGMIERFMIFFIEKTEELLP